MDSKKTGSLIAEQRKARNMTQKELAQRLNVTDKAVSKWERGIGYPEITTIPLLAQLLGVTANELMQGERTDFSNERGGERETSGAEAAGRLEGRKAARAKDRAFLFLSAALIVGSFVCVLCNYALFLRFDWSLYVLGGAALVWLVAAPLLKLGKYRVLLSLAGLSVGTAPYLFLIEYLSPGGGWALPFALPIAALSLISLWVFALTLTFVKMKAAGGVALALLLFGVVDNLAIHRFVGWYLNQSPGVRNDLSSAIVAMACACAAVFLLAWASFSKRRAR